MSEMATSLASMAEAFKMKRAPKTAMAPTPPPGFPQDPLARAAIILEADGEFSKNEMMDAIEVFMADHNIVTVYASLQTSRACTSLLQRRLAKLQEGSV